MMHTVNKGHYSAQYKLILPFTIVDTTHNNLIPQRIKAGSPMQNKHINFKKQSNEKLIIS